MSSSRRVGEFQTVQYANSGAVSQHQAIVIGGMLAIAAAAYAANETGTYFVSGVWELPAAVSTTFTVGRQVIWDASAAAGVRFNNHSLTLAAGDVSGVAVCVEQKVTGAGGGEYVKAAINVPVGTIT